MLIHTCHSYLLILDENNVLISASRLKNWVSEIGTTAMDIIPHGTGLTGIYLFHVTKQLLLNMLNNVLIV